MSSTYHYFGFIDAKKYQMHDLPGTPQCEFCRWRDGSLIVLLRVAPSEPHSQSSLVTSYSLELFAGSHLTVDPSRDFEVDNFEWRLKNKQTGYREVWNKYYYYRREIERQEGISSVEGFIGEWTVSDGNIEFLLRKLNANRAYNYRDYSEVRTCPDVRETPVNPGIPEPCNRCEYSHLDDVYKDGRLIPWCEDARDEYWGEPNCPYIKEIIELPQYK